MIILVLHYHKVISIALVIMKKIDLGLLFIYDTKVYTTPLPIFRRLSVKSNPLFVIINRWDKHINLKSKTFIFNFFLSNIC